jgi:catechol 2,3-dioxygenase-like lactoylglutathione lyase family enzyme
MEPRLSLVTLGVADLARAVAFYRDVVGWTPASVLDDVAFFDLGGTVLALWLHTSLAAELDVEPIVPPYRTVALAHNLPSPEAVDTTIAELRSRGATVVHEPAATGWGGYSAYIEDPDGHRWEIAHNPFWPLDADGRVRLPRADTEPG